jgi:hypothetical protein
MIAWDELGIMEGYDQVKMFQRGSIIRVWLFDSSHRCALDQSSTNGIGHPAIELERPTCDSPDEKRGRSNQSGARCTYFVRRLHPHKQFSLVDPRFELPPVHEWMPCLNVHVKCFDTSIRCRLTWKLGRLRSVTLGCEGRLRESSGVKRLVLGGLNIPNIVRAHENPELRPR